MNRKNIAAALTICSLSGCVNDLNIQSEDQSSTVLVSETLSRCHSSGVDYIFPKNLIYDRAFSSRVQHANETFFSGSNDRISFVIAGGTDESAVLDGGLILCVYLTSGSSQNANSRRAMEYVLSKR